MNYIFEPIIFIEHFCAIRISDLNINLQDLELDSISFVKLIVSMEEYYNIEFPIEKLCFEEVQTVKDLCEIVEKLRSIK